MGKVVDGGRDGERVEKSRGRASRGDEGVRERLAPSGRLRAKSVTQAVQVRGEEERRTHCYFKWQEDGKRVASPRSSGPAAPRKGEFDQLRPPRSIPASIASGRERTGFGVEFFGVELVTEQDAEARRTGPSSRRTATSPTAEKDALVVGRVSVAGRDGGKGVVEGEGGEGGRWLKLE